MTSIVHFIWLKLFNEIQIIKVTSLQCYCTQKREIKQPLEDYLRYERRYEHRFISWDRYIPCHSSLWRKITFKLIILFIKPSTTHINRLTPDLSFIIKHSFTELNNFSREIDNCLYQVYLPKNSPIPFVLYHSSFLDFVTL